MRTLFNDNWSFGKYAPDASYEEILGGSVEHQRTPFQPVDLPHDWMIYQVKNLYEDSIGCYRKTFSRPEAAHVFLRFEGVYMNSRYYLNGEEIHFQPYGYSTFTIELTPYLRDGENELTVLITYLSPNTRWYSGAGIYRNVWLIEKEEAYLLEDGTYASSVEIPGTDDFTLTLSAEAVLRSGEGDSSASVIRHTVTDAEGQVVALLCKDVTLTAEVLTMEQSCVIHAVHRWDITDPYLYTLVTELLIDGTVVDSVTERIGFRTISFEPDHGFFLNGRHIKLHGACMHHDLGSLGAEVYKDAIRRQFLSLKRMGINAIRTSHNMPAVELMELADEMGMLIDSEAFDMWARPKTDKDYGNFFPEYQAKDVASWVRRDRNHTSVILWSIGNEIYDTHHPEGLMYTKLLRDEVRLHDPRHNAYTTIGSNYIAWEGAQRCAEELELSGYNYQEHLYKEHHAKYPHWNIYGSETSSTVQSRGIYHFPQDVRLLTFEDGQCSSLNNCSTNWGARTAYDVIAKDRDAEFCAGQFIWTGWDYIGEPTPYFSKNSFFGQVDTAGFEKDNYYIYQAGWLDHKEYPMVHLLPYWDFNPGQIIDVLAYSNCPRIELFFNGQSLGTRDIDRLHGTEFGGKWQVMYAPGTLRVVAYDEDGNIVATDEQSSFGDPTELTVSADRTELPADGRSLSFLSIATADADGHFVANARNRIEVTVTGAGRLVGLDNGDSTDWDEYKGTSRRLFSGRMLAIIASTKDAGDITVTLRSEGLPDKVITLKTSLAAPVPHSCASTENQPTACEKEIPVRKAELTLCESLPVSPSDEFIYDSSLSSNQARRAYVLSKDCPSVQVKATLYPLGATMHDVTFRAMTLDGVDSNATLVSVSEDGLSATVTALGDEDFYYLYCFVGNGKPHPDIVSVLPFRNVGLGSATFDPYKLVCACKYTESNRTPLLSFQGGSFLKNETTWLRFDRVDFGEFGSDEITIPIFSFDTELPVEVWLGTPEEGELLLKDTYRSPSWYNHYQSNTFKLPRRLKGLQSISLQFHSGLSVGGFTFTRFEKAFGTLSANEYSTISGDSFLVTEDGIEDIGNNVDIEFRNMDFGEKGFTKLVLCGRSHTPTCTIHVRFHGEQGDVNQIVDYPYSEEMLTLTFPLTSLYGLQRVNFIFLPGSSFDFRWFRFE